MNQNYDARSKNKLMSAFDKTQSWFKPNLDESYGKEFADQALREARLEYERLIPEIPFIGGSKVHMTEDLMESVRILAYLLVLKRHKKTLDVCKTILHRSMEIRMAKYPRLILKLGEWRAFSKPFGGYLQAQLYRTETLAEGAPKCNPRLKKGATTQWR
jgi:hypothetical protein